MMPYGGWLNQPWRCGKFVSLNW